MNDYLQRLTAAVDREMLAGIDPRRGSLEAAMHYALTVSGKRLRPLLFLSLLDACSKDGRRLIGLASALEIIHTYSLIHDDLPAMDNDDLRRGMPTVHKKFNEALALLAGDTLLTFAFEKIAAAPLAGRQGGGRHGRRQPLHRQGGHGPGAGAGPGILGRTPPPSPPSIA